MSQTVSLKSLFQPNYIGLLIGLILIMASHFGGPLLLSNQRALIAPPPKLQYYSFGFQAPISDLLWVRAIQDFDYCEKTANNSACKKNSWLSQMLYTVTELAPDFIEAYREGAVALSVLLSDTPGASRIFDKGVKLHPNDFRLAYRAAYHYLCEERNKAKAAQQFLHAAQLLGAKGDWLYSLSIRLYTDSGQKEMALHMYQQLKGQGLDEGILNRMREKLGVQE